MADILLVISIPMSSLYDIYLNPNVKKIAILGTLPSIFWYKQIYDVFLCLVIPRYPCRDDIYLDIYIHIYPVLSAAARVYCGIPDLSIIQRRLIVTSSDILYKLWTSCREGDRYLLYLHHVTSRISYVQTRESLLEYHPNLYLLSS